MCVVSTLEVYFSRSKDWRKDQTQLLLSFVKPHVEVVSSTISGWIKKVLHLAGIDTQIFKAHSTRSASTSKTELHGLSISDILDRGSWSNSSTWQKFYHKQIETPGQRFQKSLFS